MKKGPKNNEKEANIVKIIEKREEEDPKEQSKFRMQKKLKIKRIEMEKIFFPKTQEI